MAYIGNILCALCRTLLLHLMIIGIILSLLHTIYYYDLLYQLMEVGGWGWDVGVGSNHIHLNWAWICKRGAQKTILKNRFLHLQYVAWRASTSNRLVVPARQAGWESIPGLLKRPKNTGSVLLCACGCTLCKYDLSFTHLQLSLVWHCSHTPVSF